MSIIAGVGSPQAVAGASGGKVYGFNNISNVAPLTVAPANTSRKKITFHNPGTQDVFIGPALINNTVGSTPSSNAGVAFTPTTTLYGGCYRVFANGGTLVIDGECQGAWQALAASGTTNQLTVVDTNV